MFLKLIKDLGYGFYIQLACIFNINQNTIQIYDGKDIKLFSKYLINITLKTSQSIEKFKMYNLIFKIAIFGSKSGLLFIRFLNFYLVINTGQI